MNKNSIGEFITELRKERKLTQEQLAEKIGVTDKTISKWETNKSTPDITNLELLASFFEITQYELLAGKRIDLNSRNISRDLNINESLSSYIKRMRKKYIVRFIILCFIFITCIGFLFFINNYNKSVIYKFNGDNDDFSVSGYLVLNQTQSLIFFDNLVFDGNSFGTSDEPKIKDLLLSLTIDGSVVFTKDYTYLNDDNEFQLISGTMEKVSFVIDQRVKENLYMMKKNLNCVGLLIQYTDDKDEIHKYVIDLNFAKTFSNNKLFY